MKVILIIDKEEEDKEEEDFENLIELLTEFAEEGGRETLVFLNKKSLKISEINYLIREYRPDIILIGHVLRGIFKECDHCKLIYGPDVKFTNCPSCHLDGQEAVRRLDSLKGKVISMGNSVLCSRQLISEYKQLGVNHFSGRDHRKIVSCILEKCECKNTGHS